MGTSFAFIRDRRLGCFCFFDSHEVAYAPKTGAKWTLVASGRPGLAYDGIGEVSLYRVRSAVK